MIIDLSVALSDGMPVYPGDPSLDIKTAATLQHEGYLDHTITMGTHNGTHIDAPAHMLENGQTLGDFPVDTFVGRGRYVQAFDLQAVQAAGVEEGDIVLFNTGMSGSFYEPVYFTDYPAMSQEIANYLVDKKAKMVGVDTCSIDNDPAFPIHKILLGGDVLAIENLTNLTRLAGKEFTVYALPMKFDLDGAPARVIAEVRS